MSSRYIERSLEPVLKRAVREFPALVMTGPRQSGKTTTLKHLFEKTHEYVSLEPPDIRAVAASDPRGFLEMHAPPVIFDEVQYAPELLPYIKERIDAKRDRCGQYLLTGSLNLLLAEKTTECLAGRAAVLRLLPLSRREVRRQPGDPMPWETARRAESAKKVLERKMWNGFLRGSYPELVANHARSVSLWHGSYARTYLERDVRTIRQVGDLSQFQDFLKVLAARSAQLLNLTETARDLGVAVNTAKSWLSVLEATFQVIILRPYYANIAKRLVKTPKVYFMDVGTLCYLTGLKDPDHAASGPMGGPILETAVLSEIVKTLTHRGIDPQVYFWRTSAGAEVDIVLDTGARLIPIEVKLSATPRTAMAESIVAFASDLGDRVGQGYLIHTGDVTLPLVPGVTAIPFGAL